MDGGGEDSVAYILLYRYVLVLILYLTTSAVQV